MNRGNKKFLIKPVSDISLILFAVEVTKGHYLRISMYYEYCVCEKRIKPLVSQEGAA